jgi:hypothetical protein
MTIQNLKYHIPTKATKIIKTKQWQSFKELWKNIDNIEPAMNSYTEPNGEKESVLIHINFFITIAYFKKFNKLNLELDTLFNQMKKGKDNV